MKIIDQFLKAIEEIFIGMDPRTFWPLNGGQVDAYFDVAEALDMYYKLTKLKKTKSIQEIAEIMPAADIIRLFLQHNAIIGLKVAHKLNIDNIPAKKRLEYTLLLFDILKAKVQSDIFCLNGKNLIFNDRQLNEVLKIDWYIPKLEQDKKKIAFLTIDANNFCYSLYYDLYMTGGFYIHGPYNVSKKFGEHSTLIIRDYHDVNPKNIWPKLNFPYKTMKILAIYKNLDLKINFANHPTSKESVGDKLIAYKIIVDNKEYEFQKIDQLINIFEKATKSQFDMINKMSDLDKIRKGALIEYYLFKDFRQGLKSDWKPPKIVEENIEKFGDKFIKQFKLQDKPEIKHWRKLFDPRNDYY